MAEASTPAESAKIGRSKYTQRFSDSITCIDSVRGRTENDPIVSKIEQAAIARRRKWTGRLGEKDYTGLALSGGGIRSASFCLGVLQALDSEKGLAKVDYLSTVSGGGYIGCCLTAAMSKTGGIPTINEKGGGFGDTDTIRHIRDFSNYLIPRGKWDVVTTIGLVARGLAANASLVLPMMVLGAVVLAVFYPTPDSLRSYGLLCPLIGLLSAHNIPFIPGFPITTAMLLFGVALLVAWALRKSFKVAQDSKRDVVKSAELNGGFVTVWRSFFVVTLCIAWLEFQPVALNALATPINFATCTSEAGGDAKDAAQPTQGSKASEASQGVPDGRGWPKAKGCIDVLLKQYLVTLTPWLSPFAALVAFLSRNVTRAARPDRARTWTAFFRRFSAKAALLASAVILPSLIWLAYLQLTARLQTWDYLAQSWKHQVVLGLLALGTLLLFGRLIDPNITSLHRLYRDRLAKAFLFHPTEVSPGGDRAQIDPKLYEIDPALVPFPIINAALNLEGSAFANKRGRNADFFEFTPEFVGSDATGWLGTVPMAKIEPKLDVGTAMAISGAAFSPNMGSATVKALVPTLALLNLRLGFWLKNPKKVGGKTSWYEYLPGTLLFKEMFSRIDEDAKTVYVTDGGNIENLGLHALLKRRCKLIVAVDAEADPAMTFASYLKLERYARIDLGVLIDLPWQAIRDRTLKASDEAADGKVTKRAAPHIAIGEIRYGDKDDDYGTLVYVKASLTGDESDYILDYKARNPDFPHETTGDQFFGEEQLEVYRALGFHTMKFFLEDKASAEVGRHRENPRKETAAEVQTRVRQALRGAKHAAQSHQSAQVPVDDQPGDEAGHQRDQGGDD